MNILTLLCEIDDFFLLMRNRWRRIVCRRRPPPGNTRVSAKPTPERSDDAPYRLSSKWVSDVYAFLPKFAEGLHGSLYGDKGYISKDLRELLREQGVNLVYKVRKNMDPLDLSVSDEVLLKKRMLIESVIKIVKTRTQLEYTRHRSYLNFQVNVVSALGVLRVCFSGGFMNKCYFGDTFFLGKVPLVSSFP